MPNFDFSPEFGKDEQLTDTGKKEFNMNKSSLFSKLPALLAFSALAVFAQQEQPQSQPPAEPQNPQKAEFMLGPRLSIGLNNFSTGYSEVDKEMKVKTGLGFGVGLALSIPILDSDLLTFNPELNFLYRKLFGYTDPGIGVEFLDGKAEVDMTEFAASIPAILRYNLGKIYLAGGVQLDIPFNAEFVFEEDGRKASLGFKKRAAFDFGAVVGLGYNIKERVSADFRWVKGLTKPSKDDKKSSFDQFGIGITYLFSLPKPEVKCECSEPAPVPEPEPELEQKLEVLNSQNVEVYKDERGTVLSMSDILFESGKAELKEELKINLTELAGILKSFLTESYVVVEGHTDNVGTAEFNQTLSEQRAAAVLQFLMDRGIDGSKLKSVGHGLTKPIADNSTAEGRAKNRRVELVITKNPNQEQ
jgi:outer membrane protein OmpA-like peptidoglycan-associated protein